MSLPRASVYHPIATLMFFFSFILLGMVSLQRLSIELFPELNYPGLMIRTEYADASAEEVVEFVTRPLEEVVSSVSGVKRVSSVSRTGLSIVMVEFYWGTNMDYASLKVREKLDEVRLILPANAGRPKLLHLDPSSQPIIEISVSGVDLRRLTTLCRDVIRRRLEQIRGIAFVDLVGGLESQIEVQVNPDKLLAYNISIDDIARALKENNVSLVGGTIKRGRYRHAIRVDGELHTLQDIRQVSIMQYDGKSPVLLGDIANIYEVPGDRSAITRLNGKEAVGLLLTKEAGANTVASSKAVSKVLDQLKAEYPELGFFIVSNQSDFIEQSIINIRSSIMWGGLLAFLSLFLFLRNTTYPLAIGVSIPISIITTFIVMHFMGISLNMMSLGGLALGVGILVDNSIVVLENMFRFRENGFRSVQASIAGAEEVSAPLLASTLTTCAVFLPIAYISGIAGQLFRDLSLTVAVSLFCSLAVSLSLLPVLFSGFKARPRIYAGVRSPDVANGGRSRDGPIFPRLRLYVPIQRLKAAVVPVWGICVDRAGGVMRFIFSKFERTLREISDAYRRLLRVCLDNKVWTLVVVGMVFAFTVLVADHLERRLFPPLQSDEVKYRLELFPDATLYQTAEVVGAIEANFVNDPSVDYVFSRIGSVGNIFMSREAAAYRAELTIHKKTPCKMTPLEWIGHLKSILPTQYRYNGDFVSGEKVYRQVLGVAEDEVQVNVRGSSWEKLVPAARMVCEKLTELPEVQQVQSSYNGGATQLRISIDRAKAASYGISIDQVVGLIKKNIRGVLATRIKRFDRFIDIFVRPGIEWRDDWKDIETRAFSVAGKTFFIRDLIHQKDVEAPEELLRENQEYVVRLGVSMPGVHRKDAIRKLQQVISGMKRDDDVHIEIGGLHSEYRRMMFYLRFAFLLSLVLVYIILAAQFESFRYPLVILLTVPVGVVGGVWLLALSGSSFNVISGIGFIVLAGIVVNDAIIKVDFINKARMNGFSLRESIYEAGEKRFRPIVITTVTTVFGLLPMALSGGTGSELRQPLAVVLIGGLTVATLFTLVVIPVVYELVSSK